MATSQSTFFHFDQCKACTQQRRAYTDRGETDKMAELTVTIATHHFVVRNVQERARKAVIGFAQRYVQWGAIRVEVPGRRPIYKRGPIKVFAAATENRSEFRFHINTLKEFKEHLALDFIKDEMIEWQQAPIPTGREVVLPVRPEWSDREHQHAPIAYGLLDDDRSKFIDMQTGKGKSYCSLRIISERGVMPVIIVKPMYLDKWVIDIRKTYDIAVEDLMVVRGSAQLQALLLLAQAGQMDAKVVLVSNKTIQNWIKLYEKFGEHTLDQGYVCLPEQFFEQLQSGYRLIDEVHQDFHLNFKIDLYTNVERSLSLSATLLSDDDFINKMYEVAYPSAQRFKGAVYDKYIESHAVIYRATDPKLLRWQDPASKNYSHHVFEKSIMRHPQMLQNYFALINQVLRGIWLTDKYQAGDKAIIFCASIDMCTALTQFLKQRYPDKDVRRYVEEDSYDNLMLPDIRVTTLISAGTAVDIPQLTATLLTTAVSSSQSNIQGFGRLRKLSDDRTPTFAYFTCEDIPKHVEYHERKHKLLEQRSTHYKPVYINQPI